MWLAYDNTGNAVVIYDENVLNMVDNYFEIDEEPDFTLGIVKTDGKTWWYEDFPSETTPEKPPLTLEERLAIVLDSMRTERVPSDKLGQDWIITYIATMELTREYVPSLSPSVEEV